ncbi:GAF domain-containing sensor histidine kinase [Paracoccus aminovorans]|uniref:GAF domain-containing sensor histidine kinase n=1 Tax=Paracoccus aminovorans TaxID=34004 RepID=UPI000784BA5C|nr:GAF domain-containing sensor histidine kinase [Paracoccus aminovorans]
MSVSVEDWAAEVADIAAIDEILEVICQLTGLGVVAVAHVTRDRWMACNARDRIGFGLASGTELPLAQTFCQGVCATGDAVIFDDAPNDPVYSVHPLPGQYGIVSYISVPITLPDGLVFGTLCGFDARPNRLRDSAVPGLFGLFAQLIARHIEDRRALRASRQELAETRETARLREQFLAVLGHDLRNPLAALRAGTNILGRGNLDDEQRELVDAMRQTTERMAQLVENLLDLARGRLAGGIRIDPASDVPLTRTLGAVLDEIARAHPERRIETDLHIAAEPAVDPLRFAQMFSNLLGNAVTHGCPDTPIRVSAASVAGRFELSVANGGQPIPAEAQERLFQPYFRQDGAVHGGLGLGLYIAAQIARAHGGSLSVQSSEAETRFTFSMPLASG